MSISLYEKQEKLGEGSYGVVYRATDTRDKSTVALKILKIDNLEDGVPSTLLREISILKTLNHINIIGLKDVCTSSLPIFLAFEYMDSDLRTLLNHIRRPLKESIIKSYAFQLIAGINFIHSHRIIHRDIKPDNLLLSKSGLLKICDFGMSRYFTVPMRPYTKGVVTLWYKAPELLVSTPYDLSIDMWSVGCIIYEMATGSPLFPGDGHIDQLMKIISILGTPTEDVYPGFYNKVKNELGFDMPNVERVGLAREFGDKCDYAMIDLIEKVLVYDPAKRLSAKDALNHPYFNDISIDMRHACVGITNDD